MNCQISITQLFLSILFGTLLIGSGCAEGTDIQTYLINQETAETLDGTWRVTSFINDGEERIPDTWMAVVLNFNYSTGPLGKFSFEFISDQNMGRVVGRFEVKDKGKKLARDVDNSDGVRDDEYDLHIDGENLTLRRWTVSGKDSVLSQFVARKQ